MGGAFSAKHSPAVKSVVLVIRVDDMQVALGRIVNAGGKVIQERSRIGEAVPGYDAYFLDPNGNEMGIYSER